MRQSGGGRLFRCCKSDKSKLQELQNLLEQGDCEELKKFLSDNNYFKGNEKLQLCTADLISIYSFSDSKFEPILGNFTKKIQVSE